MIRAALLGVLLSTSVPGGALAVPAPVRPADSGPRTVPTALPALSAPDDDPLRLHIERRMENDLAALGTFRPGYPFWSHIFRVPDGSIAFGNGRDGRLLAVLPVRGEWSREGRWEDASLRELLNGRDLPSRLGDRRDEVARILEGSVGAVLHNPTRGDFLSPNARRYAGFLGEWGRIYERFGMPAELGLAQAVVESGLAGTIKSEAGAIGFCQWLPRNWRRLQRLTPWVIEVDNQTTQAAYCAAYLTVLSTKYGSFIPALSEHHAGATNVGRTLINGGRLGAEDVRERYLTGGEFARDLRVLSPRTFRDVLGSYGPRSFLYAEMVFGNMTTVADLREAAPQERIVAIRVPRAVPLDEVARRSGLSVDEVRRFNPALVYRVPKDATLYLPEMIEGLGSDASFWHEPASPAFTDVLHDFVRTDVSLETWEHPEFESVLLDFRRRFRETGTEEGHVMDAVIGYVMEEIPLSRRILTDFRADPEVERLFERGVRLRRATIEEAREPIRGTATGSRGARPR